VTDLTLPLDRLHDPLPIEPPPNPFDATIRPPGSKSLTCRAYVLAALADGETRISRPLRADDTENLLQALCTLGAEARWDGDDALITGTGGRFPRGGEVNLGDGGAPTRFMIAAACLAAEPVLVDGSPRMRKRPIAEGVGFLRQLGARIEYAGHEDRLPVRVLPSPAFVGGDITIGATSSSQSISALLLVGPFLPRGIRIRSTQELTSRPYVTLTEEIIRSCAGSFERPEPIAASTKLPPDGEEHWVRAAPLTSFEYAVEPDVSSAIYWLCAAALRPGARATIPGISASSAQPDLNAVLVLAGSGASVEHRQETGLSVLGGPSVSAFRDDARHTPDAAVALGAVAAMASGESRLTGLHTLRVKETDRIAALAGELRRIGCTVETTDDSITIDPATRHDEPAVIETYNDHRMAMAFAVLGLARPGISIRDPACVSKSYPAFWRDLARLYD
jgi:3-phosphoshikimate 1-carboxyvinyltransferase